MRSDNRFLVCFLIMSYRSSFNLVMIDIYFSDFLAFVQNPFRDLFVMKISGRDLVKAFP